MIGFSSPTALARKLVQDLWYWLRMLLFSIKELKNSDRPLETLFLAAVVDSKNLNYFGSSGFICHPRGKVTDFLSFRATYRWSKCSHWALSYLFLKSHYFSERFKWIGCSIASPDQLMCIHLDIWTEGYRYCLCRSRVYNCYRNCST